MSNNTVDVMIYTKNQLSDDQFDAVAQEVRAMEGVVRFDRNLHLPNFIMVAYQAGQTKALPILNKLTRLGFNATLVGI